MSDTYSSERIGMRMTLQRLSKLQMKVDPERAKANGAHVAGRAAGYGTTDDAESQEKMARMSPFERAQYKAANEMKNLRVQLELVDRINNGRGSYSKAESARAQQEARKLQAKMDKLAKDVQREGAREGKEAEAKECMRHIDRTKGFYREAMGVTTSREMGMPGSAEELETRRSGAARHQKIEDLDTAGLNQGDKMSIRDDSEFAMFFEQTTKNDVAIDQALDRISAGMQRLQQQADNIKTELNVQSTLLDETDAKVDKVEGNIKGLNKKLRQTLKKVDQDKMCMYFFCFLLLLGVIGGVLAVTGVIGPKDKSKSK